MILLMMTKIGHVRFESLRRSHFVASLNIFWPNIIIPILFTSYIIFKGLCLGVARPRRNIEW